CEPALPTKRCQPAPFRRSARHLLWLAQYPLDRRGIEYAAHSILIPRLSSNLMSRPDTLLSSRVLPLIFVHGMPSSLRERESDCQAYRTFAATRQLTRCDHDTMLQQGGLLFSMSRPVRIDSITFRYTGRPPRRGWSAFRTLCPVSSLVWTSARFECVS